MKRWITSAIITLAFLLALCIISSFFTLPKSCTEQNSAQGQSSVTVIKKTNSNKKNFQKTKEFQQKLPSINKDIIALPDKIELSQEENIQESIPEEISQGEDENEEEDEGEEIEQSNLSAGGEKAKETYKTYALKKIASKKAYPLKSRAKGQEGNVRLRVLIDTDGRLIELTLVEPCEFAELNDAALNAVKKAAPFKKMQNKNLPLEILLTMEFKLTTAY